ncbi:hypothetical protein [Nonomuraea sp. NPDC003201]
MAPRTVVRGERRHAPLYFGDASETAGRVADAGARAGKMAGGGISRDPNWRAAVGRPRLLDLAARGEVLDGNLYTAPGRFDAPYLSEIRRQRLLPLLRGWPRPSRAELTGPADGVAAARPFGGVPGAVAAGAVGPWRLEAGLGGGRDGAQGGGDEERGGRGEGAGDDGEGCSRSSSHGAPGVVVCRV